MWCISTSLIKEDSKYNFITNLSVVSSNLFISYSPFCTIFSHHSVCLPLFQSLLHLTSNFQVLVLARCEAALFSTIESVSLCTHGREKSMVRIQWFDNFQTLSHCKEGKRGLNERTDVPAHLLKHVFTIRWII